VFLLYRVVPSAFPAACQLRLRLVPAFQEHHTRLQRTDHRRPMPDTVDEALVALDSDRKPSPPSPSPSPDANDSTGAFIRLQHGLALSDRPTVTYPASDSKPSEQNKHSPGNGNERSLSSLPHPGLPPAPYVFLSPHSVAHLDVNSPSTRSSLYFFNSHTSTHST